MNEGNIDNDEKNSQENMPVSEDAITSTNHDDDCIAIHDPCPVSTTCENGSESHHSSASVFDLLPKLTIHEDTNDSTKSLQPLKNTQVISACFLTTNNEYDQSGRQRARSDVSMWSKTSVESMEANPHTETMTFKVFRAAVLSHPLMVEYFETEVPLPINK